MIDRDTLHLTTLVGFGLILVSFFVRGFGQFVVGQAEAVQYAGPVALAAFLVLLGTAVVWTLDRVGLLALDER